jgi:pyruvate dehydrogenase E2 component (dihydrolipoamide acetyltransferase)
LYIQVTNYFIMAVAVIMPRQGQSVESCILTEWYKKEGEQISKGDLLFAYETDKAAFEEEAPQDGLLLACFFEEGDEVPVLQSVAVVGVEGESVDEFRPQGDQKTPVKEEEANVGAVAEIVPVTQEPLSTLSVAQSNGRTSISPRARKLACKKRVVLDHLQGTGPGGRIIERDVLEAIRQGKRLTPLAQKKMEAEGLTVPGGSNEDCGKYKSGDLLEPTPSVAGSQGLAGTGSYSDQPLSNVRKIIAGAMRRSLQNSAQLTHHMSANASGMLELRRQAKTRMKEGYPHNITLNDMVCYAVIRSLLLHPGANAHFLGESIRQFKQVNLGLAVDTDRGLMVPALLNADRLSLPGLSDSLKEMAESSKQGNISPDLIIPAAASFTVSNLGNYGVEMFTPVINLPQVAILGVNTIIQRPTVLPDGNFGFQPFMGLSLTYDHQAIDGGPATLFLAEIKKQIESLSKDLL